MPIRAYHDFVLFTHGVVEDAHGLLLSWRVRVFDSPVGQGEDDDTIDLHDYLRAHGLRDYEDLQAYVRELEGRRLDLQLDEQLRLGRLLGELMLPPRARALYEQTLAWLRDREEQGLRLRLRLEGALADLPWEYACLSSPGHPPSASGFLALNPRLSIVRHEALELRPVALVPGEDAPQRPPGDLPVEGTAWLAPAAAAVERRVVIAMATPGPYLDYPPLRWLPQEQVAIRRALDQVAGLDDHYLPEYRLHDNPEAVGGATYDRLSAELAPATDIFHFSGHGQFDKRPGPHGTAYAGEGWLILADADNLADRRSAGEILDLVSGCDVRLVVLGACESAQRDRFHKLSSVAVSLLKGRIPCVVAMQFTIRDSLAAAFAAALYEALVAGLQIDEAVALGRSAIWSQMQRDGRLYRDWGVPVLYLRTPGGRIFPPVTDEAARRRAERRSQERFDLSRAWWEWAAGDTLPTEEQLARLAEAGEGLELSPLQGVLLLRAAVVRDAPAGPWLGRLRAGRESAQALLDAVPGSGPPAEVRRILGLDPALDSGRPEGVDPLAWAAVQQAPPEARQTAALALAALEPDPPQALDRLEDALGHTDRWPRPRAAQRWPGRWWRRAELRGALADADPVFERLNAHQPPGSRLGAWLWRVVRRLRRDGHRLWRVAAGGAIGAGLGLGAMRFILALFGQKAAPAAQLAVYGVWGAALALAVCYGLLLADPLLLRPLQLDPAPRLVRGRYRHFALAVGLGTTCAGLALLVLGVLGALDLLEDTLVAPLGFLAGLGLALALYGQPAAGWRAASWRSWLRLAMAAAGSALVQWILDMNPGRGVGTAIAWPYTRYAAYFTAVLDRWWPGLTGYVPGWAYALGRLDAALAGAVLALGITLGMIAAARRLPEYRPGPADPAAPDGQDPALRAGR